MVTGCRMILIGKRGAPKIFLWLLWLLANCHVLHSLVDIWHCKLQTVLKLDFRYSFNGWRVQTVVYASDRCYCLLHTCCQSYGNEEIAKWIWIKSVPQNSSIKWLCWHSVERQKLTAKFGPVLRVIVLVLVSLCLHWDQFFCAPVRLFLLRK